MQNTFKVTSRDADAVVLLWHRDMTIETAIKKKQDLQVRYPDVIFSVHVDGNYAFSF